MVSPPSPECIVCCRGPQYHRSCTQGVPSFGAGGSAGGVGGGVLGVDKEGFARGQGGWGGVCVELVMREQLSCGLNIHTEERAQEHTHTHTHTHTHKHTRTHTRKSHI